MLASSSVAALLIGGGARPAIAACANTVGPGAVASFTNPSGQTIACVTFNNATVSGNVVNAGTITPGGPSGIQLTNQSTINGSVSNSGTISVSGNGIATDVSGNGDTFFGGITNSGTITAGAAGDAIKIFATSNFAGGITNTGGVLKSGDSAIQINDVFTFAGGITNTGTISAAQNNGILYRAPGIAPQTFIGNISNGGTITAPKAGILVTGTTTVALAATLKTFAGAIVNSGTISAGQTGIKVNVAESFTGGITNNGSIVATAKTGILVSGLTSHGGTLTTTFAGGIVGSGTISAGAVGIKLTDVANFSGGISSGSITAGATGILVTQVPTFAGGITTSGSISAVGKGIWVDAGTVTAFSGNIVNNATISGNGGNFYGIFVHATNATSPQIVINGNITNNGAITASGTGEAILVANTMNGGIVNNGVLSAAATGTSTPIAIVVGIFGTSTLGIVNNSTGTISGGGIAAIFVNDTSTFLGGITNAGLISSANGNGIFVELSTIFSGGINNSGTISGKTGIIVSGISTFSGAIVNTGNITGTGGTAVRAAAGNAVTFDQEAGTITGNIVLPNANADTLNISGGSIAGNITGAGTQIINFNMGAGAFTYNSNFTNFDVVNINSGTVVLNGADSALTMTVFSGGILAGTGTLDPALQIFPGGTLAPGTPGGLGTLTINGSLQFFAGSFYAINIEPGAGNNSKTALTGAANLGGNGTVVVTPLELGRYDTIYQILTTTTGITGEFAGLKVNGDYTGTMTLDYTTSPGDVDLDTNGALLLATPLGANVNQQNVINAINTFILNGGTLPANFENFGNLSNAALLNALTKIDGEDATGAATGTFQLVNDFFKLLSDMALGTGGGGGTGGGTTGFAATPDDAFPPDLALAYNALLKKAPPAPANFDQRWTAWGAGFGGAATYNGNAVIGSNNLSAGDFGFAGGMDYHAAPDLKLGFALAGSGTNWSLAQNLGSGRSDVFQVAGYGIKHYGPLYLTAMAAFGNSWFTTNRIAALGDQLRATFDGQSYALRGDVGYRYAVLPTAGITPYAAVQSQWFHTPAYSETDLTGGGFGLTFNSQTANDTRTELGARADDLTALNNLPLILRARLAWAHDSVSNAALGAVFEVLPGAPFTVNGAAVPKNSALASAGAQLFLTPNWSVEAKFDGEFASTAQTYAGTGTLRYAW